MVELEQNEETDAELNEAYHKKYSIYNSGHCRILRFTNSKKGN